MSAFKIHKINYYIAVWLLWICNFFLRHEDLNNPFSHRCSILIQCLVRLWAGCNVRVILTPVLINHYYICSWSLCKWRVVWICQNYFDFIPFVRHSRILSGSLFWEGCSAFVSLISFCMQGWWFLHCSPCFLWGFCLLMELPLITPHFRPAWVFLCVTVHGPCVHPTWLHPFKKIALFITTITKIHCASWGAENVLSLENASLHGKQSWYTRKKISMDYFFIPFYINTWQR